MLNESYESISFVGTVLWITISTLTAASAFDMYTCVLLCKAKRQYQYPENDCDHATLFSTSTSTLEIIITPVNTHIYGCEYDLNFTRNLIATLIKLLCIVHFKLSSMNRALTIAYFRNRYLKLHNCFVYFLQTINP